VRYHGYSVRGFARAQGLHHGHLLSVLNGVVRPSQEVRTALCRELDTPITDLFTPEAIELPYLFKPSGHVEEGIGE
jgi:transcriptional regulator with XRE-family HTH domain